MEVLRKAPGTIACKLEQVPHSIRPLAALATCRGLSATCTLPCKRISALSDLPAVSLYVDTSPENDPEGFIDSDVFHSSDLLGTHKEDTVGYVSSNRSVWLQNHSVARHDRSLFSLRQRRKVVACSLVARSTVLRDITVVLPPTGCLVFGPGSVEFQRVTFKGARRSRRPCEVAYAWCLLTAWLWFHSACAKPHVWVLGAG